MWAALRFSETKGGGTLTPNPAIVRATQGTENVALGLNSSLENSLLTHLAKQSNKCHPKVTLCFPL